MQKAGYRETGFLFALLISSNASVDAVQGFVTRSGTGALINALIVFCIALLGAFVIRTSGEADLFSVINKVYGKSLGVLLLFLFFVFTIANASARMDVYGQAIKSHVLTETNKNIILCAFALCGFFASYFGIEATTRYSVITFLGYVIFVLIILLSSFSEIKVTNIMPVLGRGDFGGVFAMLYVFSDIMYIYILSKRVTGKVGRACNFAVLCGLIISVVTAFFTLCVPYPVSKEYAYPLYTLASLANSSVVFQRLDGIVFLMWMFLGFVSVGALFYFASEILKEVFDLKDRKASSAIISVCSLSLAMTGFVDTSVVRGAASLICFVFLPITAIAYKILRRKGNA